MIDLLLNIITHPAFSAVTFFTGLILGNYFFLYRDRRKEFNKAATVFRDAFVDDKHAIQQAIETPISDDQGFFLMSKLHKGDIAITLEKAKIIFEPYLTATDLKGFNAAWENYIEWPRHFQGDYNNKEKTFEMLQHLEALLRYAAPK